MTRIDEKRIGDYTADELREAAAERERSAQESWERSDTDGFLSQWASGLTAQLYRTQATLADGDGTDEFPAVFTTDGERVPARQVRTRYGTKWAVFASAEEFDSYNGDIIAWLSWPETARQAANLAKKGYRIGYVRAKARAVIKGTGTGLSGQAWVTTERVEKGFDPTEELVAWYDPDAENFRDYLEENDDNPS